MTGHHIEKKKMCLYIGWNFDTQLFFNGIYSPQRAVQALHTAQCGDQKRPKDVKQAVKTEKWFWDNKQYIKSQVD